MKAHYEKLIAELDKCLDIVRAEWLKSRTGWDERLDIMLDERFKLMVKRDAGQ